MSNIYPQLTTSEIYDKLRTAHQEIKAILWMDNYDELSNEEKNAIDAVHSVLYLVEGEFSHF